MLKVAAARVALGIVSICASCTADYTTAPPAPHIFLARTSAQDAVNGIVAARCERARRCERQSDVADVHRAETCFVDQRYWVSRNFDSTQSCIDGVSPRRLDTCIIKIRAVGCGEEDNDTKRACRGAWLCAG
jgi:hypothetical protein